MEGGNLSGLPPDKQHEKLGKHDAASTLVRILVSSFSGACIAQCDAVRVGENQMTVGENQMTVGENVNACW